MSIFDKVDYSETKDELLNYTINKINNFLNIKDFIKKYSIRYGVKYHDESYSLKWLINKFIIEILKEPDYDFYCNKLNEIEYIELFYNSHIFLNSYLCNFYFDLNKNYADEFNGILNSIFININNHNIDLIEEKIKYKNINKLISNLENKDWSNQMTKFFSEKKIIEREKILNWFNGHIEKKIRKEINNNFFNQERINKLFSNLNNLYKHFDKTNNTYKDQIEKYQNYQKLSEEEKFKQTEEDARLILYILIEHENKII